MSAEDLKKYVEAAQAGDENAFRMLYELSYSKVKAACARQLKNPWDVDDAVQKTYIQIYTKLDTLQDPTKFTSWATTVARNSALGILRTKQSRTRKDDYRPHFSDDEYEGMDTLSTADYEQGTDPQAQVEHDEAMARLTKVIKELPEMQRTCFLLQRQDVSYKEMAEQLGIPEGTAKSNVRYAQQKIKKAMKDIAEEYHISLNAFSIIPVGTSGFLIEYEASSANVSASGAQASATVGDTTATAEVGVDGGQSMETNWQEISQAIRNGDTQVSHDGDVDVDHSGSVSKGAASGSVAVSAWKKVAIGALAAAVIGGTVYASVNVTKSSDSQDASSTTTTSVTTQADDQDEANNDETTAPTTDASTTRTTSTTRRTTTTTARATTRSTTASTTTTTTSGEEFTEDYEKDF